jgi:hypothetical protein
MKNEKKIAINGFSDKKRRLPALQDTKKLPVLRWGGLAFPPMRPTCSRAPRQKRASA